MKVSFIIPVFRPDTKIFKKCLESLKEQSFKDLEAMIVLDGPDLGAEAVLSANTDKRFKVVKNTHGGACRARNEGFKHSTGELIWFWDCDCVIEPDTCKAFVEELDKNKDVDFVYSGYKFLNEQGGIPSEPFDPWLLRCGNYISTCFPMRRSIFPGWDETVKSLQDWDLWLTVTEKGSKGAFYPGYAFSTAFPTEHSISAQGCTNEVWLDRVKAIQVKHNIQPRRVCVSSMEAKAEGIRLAKLIDADYKDVPNYKPNNYDTIIQVGFSLNPGRVKHHSGIFRQPLRKKIIFWTADNIAEINNAISHRALLEYTKALNCQTMQFVEDLYAKRIMESIGFNVSVLPLPMVNTDNIEALPEKATVLVDFSNEYRQLVSCLQHSLPDISFDFVNAAKPIKDYTAILSLNTEKTMSFNIKRMLLAGRNVISNIQSPFCGYVEDTGEIGKYVSNLVDTIRKRIKRPTNVAVDFWKKELSEKRLTEVLNK